MVSYFSQFLVELEHFPQVAYLDILGFREHVKKFINPKQGTDKEILEKIKSAMKDVSKNLNKGENKDLRLIRYKIV